MIYGKQKILFLWLMCGSGVIFNLHDDAASSEAIAVQHNSSTAAQDTDEEKVIQDICEVGSLLYKNMIDLSALYFTGIVIDTNQLYERMLLEVGKHLFQIIKILTWYGPKMIKNPKLSVKKKIKKICYISSFMVLCWLWSQEVAAHKVKNHAQYRDVPRLDTMEYVATSYQEDALSHRPKPTGWQS